MASVGLCEGGAGDEMRLGERDEEMLTNIRAVVNALHSQNDSRVTQRPPATAPHGHAAAAAAVRCNSFSTEVVVKFFMAALWNLLFSSPNLSGRRLDVYHTSTHGVALVRI